MIIPTRCFTCGAVISGKWGAYERGERELATRESSPSELPGAGPGRAAPAGAAGDVDADTEAGAGAGAEGGHVDAGVADATRPAHGAQGQSGGRGPGTRGELLDAIGVRRLCCRRHFLGNVDLMDEL